VHGLARHPVELGVQAQVLLGGEIAVERRVLEDEADVAAHLVAFGDDVVPRHPRGPGGGPHERAEHVDRRRLARPVGPEEAEGLPRADLELDAAYRLDLAVALYEAVDADGGCGA
jgi:hypothetical protein